MKRLLVRITAAATLLALGACATSSPDVISRNEAQRMSTVVDAVVLNSRPVTVDGNQSGLGGAAGGVVGAVSGSGVGGRRDGAVVGVLAAVVGAVVGNAVERAATKEDALEIIVQLKNGDRRSVVQAKAAESFNPGDPVILITTGGKVRVIKSPPITPSGAASAPG
jgi:outer membrane lipoprotein SlyB